MAGAHAHHTPQFLRARQAYWSLRNMVVKRQRVMLAIVLERCRVAKARGFLTFAKKQQGDASPSQVSRSADYLFHSENFQGHCLQLSS